MLILCIDDDKEDLEIFCEALKIIEGSIACITANDGLHALTLLSKATQLPDCIFTDINMPRMDGKMLLTNLKMHSGFKDIPVIIFFTGIHPEDEIEFIKLGAAKVLTKPARFNELVNSIRSVLAGFS